MTCSFDSGELVDLLKICGEWANDSASFAEEEYLMDYELLQGILRLGGISRNYHGDYCFVGFPAGDGGGGMFQIDMKFAISAQCEYIEAAWEFIKFAMSEEGLLEYIGPGYCTIYSVLIDEINDAIENKIRTDFEEIEFTSVNALKRLEPISPEIRLRKNAPN